MIKFKNIFKCFIIVLLIVVSLSGIRVIKVNAEDRSDPYENISSYRIKH